MWHVILKCPLGPSPNTCLQLRVHVVGLVRRLQAASLVVLFAHDQREQVALVILGVGDGTRREPAQLAVL